MDRVASRRQVPLDRCYHYRGYRYGGFGNNPYEDFILGLAGGGQAEILRREFAWRVLNCRARSMGEALQIDIIDWPLWEYPWARRPASSRREFDEPRDNPDVMCHFSAPGVLASHINREFGWLEGAWRNISGQGYRPRQYGFVRCVELDAGEASSYLVVDGNHRLSALHALGETSLEVELLRFRKVRRDRAEAWPRVRDGSIGLGHALRVFDRYFAQRNPPLVARHPAALIADAAPLWSAPGADFESAGPSVDMAMVLGQA